MERIKRYFPGLTQKQTAQLEQLGALYSDWNSKINVISRKDIDNLYEHHVLHSLAIAKFINFTDATRIADVGTGGGFPGIPLAIMFPECHFTLIDSIGKKVNVANQVAQNIGLTNVVCRHERAQDEKERFDFVVSRAVMPLPDLCPIAKHLIDHSNQHNTYPNGIICLKGGNLDAETAGLNNRLEIVDICNLFSEEFFEDKKVVYVQI